MPRNALFTPPIYPAMLLVHRLYADEPSWMLSGWIELTCWASPGWRAICETAFDVECEMQRGKRGVVYRARWFGPAVGDHCPVIDCCELALSPEGAVVSLVSED
jgi:hypothetical protein